MSAAAPALTAEWVKLRVEELRSTSTQDVCGRMKYEMETATLRALRTLRSALSSVERGEAVRLGVAQDDSMYLAIIKQVLNGVIKQRASAASFTLNNKLPLLHNAAPNESLLLEIIPTLVLPVDAKDARDGMEHFLGVLQVAYGGDSATNSAEAWRNFRNFLKKISLPVQRTSYEVSVPTSKAVLAAVHTVLQHTYVCSGLCVPTLLLFARGAPNNAVASKLATYTPGAGQVLEAYQLMNALWGLVEASPYMKTDWLCGAADASLVWELTLRLALFIAKSMLQLEGVGMLRSAGALHAPAVLLSDDIFREDGAAREESVLYKVTLESCVVENVRRVKYGKRRLMEYDRARNCIRFEALFKWQPEGRKLALGADMASELDYACQTRGAFAGAMQLLRDITTPPFYNSLIGAVVHTLAVTRDERGGMRVGKHFKLDVHPKDAEVEFVHVVASPPDWAPPHIWCKIKMHRDRESNAAMLLCMYTAFATMHISTALEVVQFLASAIGAANGGVHLNADSVLSLFLALRMYAADRAHHILRHNREVDTSKHAILNITMHGQDIDMPHTTIENVPYAPVFLTYTSEAFKKAMGVDGEEGDVSSERGRHWRAGGAQVQRITLQHLYCVNELLCSCAYTCMVQLGNINVGTYCNAGRWHEKDTEAMLQSCTPTVVSDYVKYVTQGAVPCMGFNWGYVCMVPVSMQSPSPYVCMAVPVPMALPPELAQQGFVPQLRNVSTEASHWDVVFGALPRQCFSQSAIDGTPVAVCTGLYDMYSGIPDLYVVSMDVGLYGKVFNTDIVLGLGSSHVPRLGDVFGFMGNAPDRRMKLVLCQCVQPFEEEMRWLPVGIWYNTCKAQANTEDGLRCGELRKCYEAVKQQCDKAARRGNYALLWPFLTVLLVHVQPGGYRRSVTEACWEALLTKYAPGKDRKGVEESKSAPPEEVQEAESKSAPPEEVQEAESKSAPQRESKSKSKHKRKRPRGAALRPTSHMVDINAAAAARVPRPVDYMLHYTHWPLMRCVKLRNMQPEDRSGIDWASVTAAECYYEQDWSEDVVPQEVALLRQRPLGEEPVCMLDASINIDMAGSLHAVVVTFISKGVEEGALGAVRNAHFPTYDTRRRGCNISLRSLCNGRKKFRWTSDKAVIVLPSANQAVRLHWLRWLVRANFAKCGEKWKKAKWHTSLEGVIYNYFSAAVGMLRIAVPVTEPRFVDGDI